MRRIGFAIAALIAFAWSLPAFAQAQFKTPNSTSASGSVLMCKNASGLAIPAGPLCANPVPVTAGPYSYTNPSTALSSNWLGKNTPGNLVDFQVNTTSTAIWVMEIDGTALPGNGAVAGCGSSPTTGCIVKWWQVPANSTLGVSFISPIIHAFGIVLGCSTTGPFTLTASSTCTFSGEKQ